MIEKITKITNPSFRTGVSKSGSNYTMMKVDTTEHSDVTVFAPANVGDDVILEYNDQYKNWNGKPATQANKVKAEGIAKIDEILDTVKRIEKAIGQTKDTDDIDLDGIPFE